MNTRNWIDLLDDEDIAFLKRFVLASGSLKEVASGYGISYPTVRLRLDRLIAKVQVFDSQQAMDDFERTARGLLIDGKIDAATLKTLLSAHRQAQEKSHVTSDTIHGIADSDRARSGKDSVRG